MDGGKLDVLENRINEAMERLQLVLAKSDVSNIVQIQQLEDVDETSLPTHVLDTVADKMHILKSNLQNHNEDYQQMQDHIDTLTAQNQSLLLENEKFKYRIKHLLHSFDDVENDDSMKQENERLKYRLKHLLSSFEENE
eukprot:TRINITY_DN662_c1_g4_i1.p1 TRINITY_DN662_c1_g4~~TRINITY_DN662_c1_g4_i1.p1  ORF type:complete len:148 (-),score=39.23 TRINITY_DN662_c1_g4_i1:22-438(-)